MLATSYAPCAAGFFNGIWGYVNETDPLVALARHAAIKHQEWQ